MKYAINFSLNCLTSHMNFTCRR